MDWRARWALETTDGDTVADALGEAPRGRIEGRHRIADLDGVKGLFFNGWNTCITVPDAPALACPDGLTLAAWVRADSLSERDYLVHKHGAYALHLVEYGRVSFVVWEPSGRPYRVTTRVRLTPNRWHRVAATFDGRDLIVYLDGRRAAEGAQAYTGRRTQVRRTNAPLLIGGMRPDPYARPMSLFCGAMADVRLGGRALTLEEVAADYAQAPAGRVAYPALTRPHLRKMGTFWHGCESSPFVWQGRLKVLVNDRGRDESGRLSTRLWIYDMADRTFGPHFGEGCIFPCAYAEGDRTYVYAVRGGWGGREMVALTSTDLVTWDERTVLTFPHTVFNMSVCRAGERYLMGYDICPENNAHDARTCFAWSEDLVHWQPAPASCTYSLDYYTAAVAIRHAEGWTYAIQLRSLSDMREFNTYVARSRDLVTWHGSPLNPLLAWSDEDRKIAPGVHPSDEERARMDRTLNQNASDLDLCEFEGKTVITYSWGDQRMPPPERKRRAGWRMFLAYAVHEGPMSGFLRAYFEPV